MKIIQGILILFTASPVLAAPPWTTGTYPKLYGKNLQVLCHGVGPDRVTAFRSALDECRSIASEAILQNFEVKSLTVDTEKDSALHEEVRSDSRVTGLQCEVSQSYEETNERWLLCSFDTSKASVLEAKESSMESDVSPEKTTIQDPDNFYIILSVSPGCDSVLVISSVPRIVRCTHNPFSLTLKPNDQEIIVRYQGFKPKHIPAKEWQKNRVISVYLDR